MKLGLVSLGCDKNTVDSERILATLKACGAETTRDLDEAEVVLINTCGFIDAAKQESIGAILEASRLKKDGACKAVVAVGCLVERYREELEAELPEVDLFLGLRDLDRLVPSLQRRGLLSSSRSAHPGERLPLEGSPEGQRGVRSRMRVLRDSPVEGSASFVRNGAAGRRGPAS
jgi:ribosomal protein S12 methylthiotransferase